MSDSERQLMRDVLLSDVEGSDELKARFEAQVQAIMHPPLPKAIRIMGGVLAAVFLATAPLFAWASYSFAVGGEKPLVRVLGSVMMGLGAIVFIVGAFMTARQARHGVSPGRAMQKASVFVPYAVVLVYSIAMLMIMPGLDLPATKMIAITGSLLFFWIMVWGFVLVAHLGWNRTDILLEQKRTQLEVALLREKLEGKP